MNNRIKEIRRKAELTQTQFGERIGLQQNSIARIEAGTRVPSEAVIKAICREFHVRQEWLMSGEGPMAVPTASKALDEVARRYSESRTFRAILDVYADLDDTSRTVFERYIERLTKVLAEGGDTTKVTVDPGEVSVLEKAQQGAANAALSGSNVAEGETAAPDEKAQ